MFSKTCEYGIKAAIYIATQSLENRRVKIGDVVENIESPVAFTGKILSSLSKHGLVQSQTGPYGGFFMEMDQMKLIKLSDIVFALDGDSLYNGCALGLSACNAKSPCPMHDKVIKVRAQLKSMLNTTSIYDLAIGLKSGKSILTR